MAPSGVLAEIEIYHTRPIAPTRRIALGHLNLPVESAPGLGGLLLGAVVAQHIADVDPDLGFDIDRLTYEVEAGQRIVQPRLRHRLQVDRHGLSTSHHTLRSVDGEIEFDFGTRGSDLSQVLGAIYAMERLDADARHQIGPIVRRALRWRGPIGSGLVAYLAGSKARGLEVLADPIAWALSMLGFDSEATPSTKDITRAYRGRMRIAHPDVGGEADAASQAITDLMEARRILTGMPQG